MDKVNKKTGGEEPVEASLLSQASAEGGDVEMLNDSQLSKMTSGPTPSSDTKVQNSLQDKVSVNHKFTSNYIRLTLPVPALEEVYKKEKVTEDRAHAVEAAIVRIMKTRKRLEMSNLMTEVIQTLHMFKPSPKFIKAKIERLIEQDYLLRDDQDKSILLYRA